MPDEVVRIDRPLVIMFEDEGGVVCHIQPSARATSHREFGLLVCDLARHVAYAFEVEEDEVWRWVDEERHRPTTEITRPS